MYNTEKTKKKDWHLYYKQVHAQMHLLKKKKVHAQMLDRQLGLKKT